MTMRLSATVGCVLLTIGILLTAYGLGHMDWPEDLPFRHLALRDYLIFLLASGVLVFVGAKYWFRSTFLVGTAISAALAVLVGAAWPFLVTIWFALASYVLGRALYFVLGIERTKTSYLTNFLIGAGLYGTAVGLLAHFPINYSGLYAAALAAPILLGWRWIAELARSTNGWVKKHRSSAHSFSLLDVSIAVVATVHVLFALMPELGHDALVSHLFIPAHLASRHEWGFDVTTYVWAVMPMLGDWIFSIAYLLAGETGARLVNVGFIFALAWLTRDLVLWAGGATIGARWAVLLFLSTPLTFTESSSLFIESIWASFVAGGTLAVLRACSSNGNQKAELLIGGVLLGCALAAKAVTLTILPALLLVLAWRYKSWLKPELYPALLRGMVLFLALGLIPYLTSYWLTSSPIFPFFNKFFQSPYYPAENFEPPAVFGKGVTWDLLYRVTFYSEKYLESKAGAAGFQWLTLLVPAIVALGLQRQRRSVALFVVAALSIVLTFNSTAYLRYIFPSVVMLSAVLGVAVSAWTADGRSLRYFGAATAYLVVVLNLLFLNAGAFYEDFPVKSLISNTERRLYLQQRLPVRSAVEVVNHLNKGRSPVAVFSLPLVAGLEADGIYPNWYNHRFQSLIEGANTESALAEALLNNAIDFLILDTNWGTLEKRRLIEQATEKIADFHPLTVRVVRKEHRYKHELLKNRSFASDEGWQFPAGLFGRSKDGISVNVESPAYQVVSVTPGHRYLNHIKARCLGESAQGRLQVNWTDSEGRFISADIRIFECTPSPDVHSMEVIAPPNAAHAAVYASGHTMTPLVFIESSFKR